MKYWLILTFIFAASGSALAAESDSSVADNLFVKPLTYVGDRPRNFRSDPRNHTLEPRGFRDNPIQWRETPIGFREKPIPQLDEPRNGRETPPRFIERDSIVQANTDPRFVVEKEEFPQNNSRDEVFRIETEQAENTRIKDNFSEREPGYNSINSPTQARLKDFQKL